MIVSGEVGQQDVQDVVINLYMEHNHYTNYCYRPLQSGSSLRRITNREAVRPPRNTGCSLRVSSAPRHGGTMIKGVKFASIPVTNRIALSRSTQKNSAF